MKNCSPTQTSLQLSDKTKPYNDLLWHRFTTRVRYGETDKMGIVYHPNYLKYFELGRTELMRARGLPYSELERRGLNLVVVEANCKYKGSAIYDEEIIISTIVSEATKVKVLFDYILNSASDNRLLAEGYTVLACVNTDSKVIKLPEEVISILTKSM